MKQLTPMQKYRSELTQYQLWLLELAQNYKCSSEQITISKLDYLDKKKSARWNDALAAIENELDLGNEQGKKLITLGEIWNIIAEQTGCHKIIAELPKCYIPPAEERFKVERKVPPRIIKQK